LYRAGPERQPRLAFLIGRRRRQRHVEAPIRNPQPPPYRIARTRAGTRPVLERLELHVVARERAGRPARIDHEPRRRRGLLAAAARAVRAQQNDLAAVVEVQREAVVADRPARQRQLAPRVLEREKPVDFRLPAVGDQRAPRAEARLRVELKRRGGGAARAAEVAGGHARLHATELEIELYPDGADAHRKARRCRSGFELDELPVLDPDA